MCKQKRGWLDLDRRYGECSGKEPGEVPGCWHERLLGETVHIGRA